jgi:membrane associated rhomboid family serine protease
MVDLRLQRTFSLKNELFLFILFLSIIFSIFSISDICNKTLSSTILQRFVHTNATHLLSNMIVLNFVITTFNNNYTKSNTFSIVLMAFVVNVMSIWILRYQYNLECSVGFSGIIYSLLSYIILKTKGFNSDSLIWIFSLSIPPLLITKTSFSGHLIGILSGIILYLIY